MSNCGCDEINECSAESNNPEQDDESKPLLTVAWKTGAKGYVRNRKRGRNQYHPDDPSREKIQETEISLSGWSCCIHIFKWRARDYGLPGGSGNVIVTSTGTSGGGRLLVFGSQIKSLSWPGPMLLIKATGSVTSEITEPSICARNLLLTMREPL